MSSDTALEALGVLIIGAAALVVALYRHFLHVPKETRHG